MPVEVAWDLLALGADTAAALIFYWCYRQYNAEYDQIKETPDIAVGPELRDALEQQSDKQLPYASVTGFTATQDAPLRSHYDSAERGVLQRLTLLEHRTKRIQGYWSDSDRTIRNNLNMVPFQITETRSGTGQRIEVQEPLEAEGLLESMKTTYDKFEPNKSSVMERSLERLFGEVSKGFQEKEKMLGLGVKVLGIGKLVLDNGVIRIEPPNDGRTYYLTTQSKSEVLKGVKSTVKVLKWLAVICGAVSLGYASYLAFKKLRAWQNRRDMARVIRELRAARERGDDDAAGDTQSCVICLERPREVVILDCGHICTCLSCAGDLPHPQKCPMCRQDISRVIPVFVP